MFSTCISLPLSSLNEDHFKTHPIISFPTFVQLSTSIDCKIYWNIFNSHSCSWRAEVCLFSSKSEDLSDLSLSWNCNPCDFIPFERAEGKSYFRKYFNFIRTKDKILATESTNAKQSAQGNKFTKLLSAFEKRLSTIHLKCLFSLIDNINIIAQLLFLYYQVIHNMPVAFI